MVKICKSTSRLADLVEWDWPINEQIKMCRILDILDLHILHIYIFTYYLLVKMLEIIGLLHLLMI